MRHPMQVLEMFDQRLALRRCEYIADVADELHDALRGLIAEL
jgi:hypothetical protein